MQSSTSVACRMGVMLACLIAIPLAALFGTKLPGLVSRWLDRERDSASVSSQQERCEAPPFDGSSTASPTNGPNAPEWGSRPAGPAAAVEFGQSPSVPDPLDRRADRAPTHYLGDRSRKGFPPWPPGSADPTGEGPVAISPAVFESSALPLVRVAPAEWREDSAPAEGTLAHWASSRGDPAALSQAFAETPQSKEILRGLRESGACYYALETWGARGQYYRFQARIAAGDGASYVRHFNAIEPDAVGAMASVLDQVQGWQADRGHLESAFPP